ARAGLSRLVCCCARDKPKRQVPKPSNTSPRATHIRRISPSSFRHPQFEFVLSRLSGLNYEIQDLHGKNWISRAIKANCGGSPQASTEPHALRALRESRHTLGPANHPERERIL